MLRLRTFGACCLQRADGSSIALQRRPLALLAFVAAGADGASREKTLGVLWPEVDQERARHSLAQTLYALRRSCSAEVIRGTNVLQLDASLITTDLADFEQALAADEPERAAELYAGPFLDGFHLPNAGEFERWVEGERADLARRAARAIEARATRAAQRGEARVAADWWQRLATLDPLDSRVALALVNALAAAGDVTGAIRHAQLHQTILRSELDLPPDAAVAALAERLRSGEAGVVKVSAVAAEMVPSEMAPPDTHRSSTIEQETDDAARNRTASLVSPRPQRRFPWRWAAATLLLLAVIAIAGRSLLPRASAQADRRRVVVATFENRTGDSTLAPLGDMAADWVATELARTGLVDVVDSRAVIGSPNPSGRPAKLPHDARMHELAQRVGARILVWGTYYRLGDTLEFHAEVTDAKDGSLLREVPPIAVQASDPMAGVRRLSSRVMGALATIENPRLAEWASRGGTPPSYEAYREFVDGLEADVHLEFATALTHYLRARALDSTFLQPLLYAADAEANLGQLSRAESTLDRVALQRNQLVPADQYQLDFQLAQLRGDLGKAYEAARAMARVSPTSESFVVAGQGAMAVGRPREALQWFERVNPNEGWVKGWAAYWSWLVGAAHLAGDDEAALRFAREGRRAFPNQLQTYEWLAWELAATGRTAALDAVLDSAATAPGTSGTSYGMVLYMSAAGLATHGRPNDARRLWLRTVRYFESHSAGLDSSERDYQARALLQAGRTAEAEHIAQELVRAYPDQPDFLGTLGGIAAVAGDTAVLRTVSGHLMQLSHAAASGSAAGAVMLARARVEALRGNHAVAIALIREALSSGATTYFDVDRWPEFHSLAADPGFRELLRPRG
ncbi:MAG TPA: BTAD domain-containing putative transcriptional regulator [Gemmatimonadaceae bacterium]|nr:BTAD domain-containing putative transcriptional regulator [Gemmatimonadaceae bacterium]